jgi:hypothetical protein
MVSNQNSSSQINNSNIIDFNFILTSQFSSNGTSSFIPESFHSSSQQFIYSYKYIESNSRVQSVALYTLVSLCEEIGLIIFPLLGIIFCDYYLYVDVERIFFHSSFRARYRTRCLCCFGKQKYCFRKYSIILFNQ